MCTEEELDNIFSNLYAYWDSLTPLEKQLVRDFDDIPENERTADEISEIKDIHKRIFG